MSTLAPHNINYILVNRGCSVVYTGSHAFGLIHDKSDLDIVVKVTPDELTEIQEDLTRRGIVSTAAQFSLYEGYSSPAIADSFRIGRVNFILVVNDAQFEVWARGTKECVDLARSREVGYIRREEAVAVFQRLERELLG